MMWLVVASGLYLYIFFETSVDGRLRLGRASDARAVVSGRRDAQRAPLRLGRRGADDGAAPGAALRLRPLPQLSLVFLDFGRRAAVAGVRGGHQRLHAALGPHRAVRRGGDRRVVRLAAGVQRHPGAQLHLSRGGERPPLLAALVHPHRHPARRAGGAVGAHPARAAGEDRAAAADRDHPDARARRALAGQAGAEPGHGRPDERGRRCSISTGSTCRCTRCCTAGRRPACGCWWAAGTLLFVLLPWLPPQPAQRPGRGLPHVRAAGQPHLAIARGRDDPRRGAARGRAVSLRVPQWRLRQVQGDARLW